MLEKILQFSLTQRLAVLAAALLMAGFGVASWWSLNLDAVPDITTNQVVINAEAPGMAAAEVEKLITFPIETAIGGLPDLLEVRSLSQFGLSQTTVTFEDHVPTYFARQLVSERLAAAAGQLPENLPAPALGPVSTGLGDIYQYAVESDRRSPTELRTLQDWFIKPQLRTVPGVAEVNASGGYEKQYEIQVDPQRMLARGITLQMLVDAVRNNNANAGGGFIEEGGEQLIVRSLGLVASASDIASIVVDSVHGTPITVGDVAVVLEGSPQRTGLSTRDGHEAVVGIAQMLKGANSREVSLNVDRKIASIRKQLPDDVRLTTVYDRSDLVNKTIATVQKSLLEGGLLVIAVLLLLLGNVRGALIVATAIPLSMLMAVIGMNRFGISGNLMSLGAIDFGLIVDGAVVIVENSVRRLAARREHLKRPLLRQEVRQTVWEASSEVSRPVAFAVSIITVVYLPLLALEGTEGRMFRPMAFTVVFALIGALMITLTVIPALCSLLLSGDTVERPNRLMSTVSSWYERSLARALAAREAVVGGSAALVGLAFIAFGFLGSEFIPQLDEGSIMVQPIRIRTAGEAETIRLVTAVEKKLLQVPEVTTVFSRSGTPEIATDPMPMSLTDTFVMLEPRSRWRRGLGKQELIHQMRQLLEDVPGQAYAFTQPIQMRFAELVVGVKADVGVKVFGEDLDVARDVAAQVSEALSGIPGASDVAVEQVDDIPVLEIATNRGAIARLGANVADVQQWIEVALGGQPLGQVIEGDKRFDIAVRLPQSLRNDQDAIRALPVAVPGGGSVPLESLADVRVAPSPAQISRENGHRRVVVQTNVAGGDLGGFVKRARAEVERSVQLPEGYWLEWGGQFQNLQRARARLLLVVPAALGLIFVLLFMTFGSLRQAALIFTGVPLAVTGGVFMLALRGLPFSISAAVGFIALCGVAVLNGVVLMSAINQLRERGMALEQAVREGALQRLRPVLMTALVAAVGFVPMALSHGVGSEVQRPLASVVIGGIATSTFLTLFVLPVLVTWLDRDRQDLQ